MRDKRLEEQKHRLRTLKSYGINAMVLLEGRLGVEANKENVCILVPQEHLDNIIFMDGFPVKKTKSASQTLEFLIQAHVYLQEALKGARVTSFTISILTCRFTLVELHLKSTTDSMLNH